MTVSVRLDPRTERLLDRLSRRSGATRSEVIRRAIVKVAAEEEPGAGVGSPFEQVAHLIGCGRSGRGDLSRETGEGLRRILRERRARGRG